MKLLFLILLAVLAVACSGTRYYIVEGPANLTIGATAVTPMVTVNIEEEGRAFFGPDLPEFYTTEPPEPALELQKGIVPLTPKLPPPGTDTG